LYEKLKQQILPQLIPAHSRILVAVSGGPDSIALGHVLWRYANEMKGRDISIVISHVHHGVRQESDEEEKMVVQLARDWTIPCLVHRFDAKAYAKSSGQSFQAAAREWRYIRWQEDMEKEECTLLATAHHLGDQAETVLYRMIRGSGTAGLSGIHPRKDGVIRPFLSVRKEEILSYCQKEKLPFALDYSNADPIYVRNKIRLELVPVLEREYNPRVMEALGRMAELLRWDEEFISGEVEKAWERYILKGSEGKIGLSREVFQLEKAVLSRLIRKSVGHVTGEPRGIGYSYVEQVMASEGQVGWNQDLPGLSVHVDYFGVWFKKFDGEEKRSSGVSINQEAHLGRWVQWVDSEGRNWRIGLFENEQNIKSNQCAPQEWVEIERIELNRNKLEQNGESLKWRNRLPGDRMWFQGIGHKSLKKVFQDGKIEGKTRQEIPLLAYGREVIWIPGVRTGESYRSNSTEKILGLLLKKL
jgi:tRNA(Ile)-lysidine synthase